MQSLRALNTVGNMISTPIDGFTRSFQLYCISQHLYTKSYKSANSEQNRKPKSQSCTMLLTDSEFAGRSGLSLRRKSCTQKSHALALTEAPLDSSAKPLRGRFNVPKSKRWGKGGKQWKVGAYVAAAMIATHVNMSGSAQRPEASLAHTR